VRVLRQVMLGELPAGGRASARIGTPSLPEAAWVLNSAAGIVGAGPVFVPPPPGQGRQATRIPIFRGCSTWPGRRGLPKPAPGHRSGRSASGPSRQLVGALPAALKADAPEGNAYVSTKDRATGQPIRPCLISVAAERAQFTQLVLDEPELDPVLCLRQFFNAIVSPHPYDLEAVRPVLEFDLSRYKFIQEVGVVAGLDSRPNLLDLKPVEFEHLVRELFEAIGMKLWVTQSSKDDGVDAVAVNEGRGHGRYGVVRTDC
jgi:Restriction endonuclease